uniref:Ribosomal protein S20 n=1 Tax=Hildenbrandia rivularis TaxID=135206 RepID=A0A1C9CFD1_9FLOR|nr:ribosomal protein S20 [Hildenbrandia rivularis]AOM67096.1 ribosomal protein S20 [Hildenbrandia rivularis]
MNKKLATQKRIRIITRNYYRNRAHKSSIKTIVKNCLLLIKQIDKSSIKQASSVSLKIAEAFSRIDKAVNRKVIHKNKGSRKKAFLSKLLKTKV